ncbi:MAG: alpha/beta hydrolase [Gaiellaceae bacterium]
MRAIALLAACAALALTACGGGGESTGPFGEGADQYWLFRPEGKPRTVVVFLHGLHESELEPDNHLPWLEHLAEQGNAVVYPRYELRPGDRGALRHILSAVRASAVRLESPAVPRILIGYSRGARLAVEYTAVALAAPPVPSAVMSVFPSRLDPAAEEEVDFRTINPRTRFLFLAGDRDTDVGSFGVRELLQRLRTSGFSPANVEAVLVRSRRGFQADHLAPTRDTPRAKAEFWNRADRLIERYAPKKKST